MAATTACATLSQFLSAAEPRLYLTPAGSRPDRLDGAWWPHSRDITRELPGLIAAVELQFGRIDRITLNGSLWPELPHRIAVAGRSIDVGWFTTGQPGVEVCVLSNDAGRWDLLLVPPESEAGAAEISLALGPRPLDRAAAEAWLTRTAAEQAAAAETARKRRGGPKAAYEPRVHRETAPRRPPRGVAPGEGREMGPSPTVGASATRTETRRHMGTDSSLPAPDVAEVRITAASPEVARQVAQVLRVWFASTEQRSYPAGGRGSGTRLHLIVDTAHTPEPPGGFQPWLAAPSRTGG